MVLALYISSTLSFSRTAEHLLPIGNSRPWWSPAPSSGVKPLLCLPPSPLPGTFGQIFRVAVFVLLRTACELSKC